MTKRPREWGEEETVATRVVRRRRPPFELLPEHFPLVCSFLPLESVRALLATQRAWLAAISAQAVALVVMHPAFPLETHAFIFSLLAKRDAAGCIYGAPWFYYLEHWARHATRGDPVDLRALLRLPWPYALDLAERWLPDPTSARSLLQYLPPWRRYARFWEMADRFAQRCANLLAADLGCPRARQELLAWLHLTSLVVGGSHLFLAGARPDFLRKVFGEGPYLAEGFGTAAILHMFGLSLVRYFEEVLDRPLTDEQMPLLRALATLCGETLPPRDPASVRLVDGEVALAEVTDFASEIGAVVGPDSDLDKWRELVGIVLVQNRRAQEEAGFYRPLGLRTFLL